jgi:hypothetical protein
MFPCSSISEMTKIVSISVRPASEMMVNNVAASGVRCYRGGIWMNSASCSLVSGLSRNFSATASRMMPSMSLTASVCIAYLV